MSLLKDAVQENETRGSNLAGFRQINTEVVVGVDDTTADHTKALLYGTFSCNTSTTKKCHLRLAEAIVRMDVYNNVMQRFINQPMLFPIQSIVSTDFANKLQNNTNQFTCVTTNALNHCNSMFIVFRRTRTHTHSCTCRATRSGALHNAHFVRTPCKFHV